MLEISTNSNLNTLLDKAQ